MPVLSRFIQRERLERASELVNGDVLEFGCGEAKILEYAGQRINRYVGIDRSPRILDEAKQRYPDHTFMELDVEKDTPPFDAEFDVVLMLAFVEHIFNQRHLFEICCKSLRSSGRLIVTTPTPFGNDMVHRLGAMLGLFAKSAMDDHIVIYNRKRFDIAAAEFGLELELYRRFQFACNQLVVMTKP